jgi:hypothetical protein
MRRRNEMKLLTNRFLSGQRKPLPLNQKKVEWGTLYNRVGVVKRHYQRPKVLFFPS